MNTRTPPHVDPHGLLRAELQGHAVDEDEAHHEVVALAQLWRHPVRWHVVALPEIRV